ncbi:MAG: UTP--glucose-1-phosphate uridylyltransferase [Chloroflexi bacterium]|nr:UTP--glucose-1-phosphate uridylyltransferase [Chloroflexota bacterium]
MNTAGTCGPIRKAVVPVAGIGTRLFPATKSQPKEMLPVGRKPVVQYVIEELRAAGIEQILLITGRKKAAIEDHFDADPELSQVLRQAGSVDLADLPLADGIRGVFYTRQGTPSGVADAVGLARDFAGREPIVVAFGDTIIRGGNLVARLMSAHRESSASGAVAVEQIAPEDAFRYGIVDVRTVDGALVAANLVEKPAAGSAPSDLAIVPRYVFGPAIFDAIDATRPGLGGERWLTDSIAILARESPPVRVVPLDATERRYDIGNFESYYRAFIDFALADPQYGASVRQYVSELGQRL